MSIKSRIRKIERKLPKRENNPPIIVAFYYCGAIPSKEEEAIAIKKVKELKPNQRSLSIDYIPYGFEHIIKPPRNTKLEFDKNLGLITERNSIIKLVKKYQKELAR